MTKATRIHKKESVNLSSYGKTAFTKARERGHTNYERTKYVQNQTDRHISFMWECLSTGAHDHYSKEGPLPWIPSTSSQELVKTSSIPSKELHRFPTCWLVSVQCFLCLNLILCISLDGTALAEDAKADLCDTVFISDWNILACFVRSHWEVTQLFQTHTINITGLCQSLNCYRDYTTTSPITHRCRNKTLDWTRFKRFLLLNFFQFNLST